MSCSMELGKAAASLLAIAMGLSLASLAPGRAALAAGDPLESALLVSFDSLSKWTATAGVSGAPETGLKTEGTASAKVTFDRSAANAPEWMNYYLKPANLDITHADHLTMDIYVPPEEAGLTTGPVIKLVDDTNTVIYYEYRLQNLTPGQWTTVNIPLWKTPGKLGNIVFYMQKSNDASWNGRSSVTYLIDNLRQVEPASYIQPTIALTSANAGNIFTTDENAVMGLKISDFYKNGAGMSLRCNVKDARGNTVYTMPPQPVTADANGVFEPDPLRLPLGETGTFTLTAELLNSDGTVCETQTAALSRVWPALANSARMDGFFGVNSDTDDVSLEALAGIGNARTGYSWRRWETAKGVLTVPAGADDSIDALIANGIQPEYLLCYGNDFYDGGGIPYTEEGVTAFVNYVKAVVTRYKGKVKYYEVWNEPNLAGFNPTNRSAADYANLLKAVYPAIKAIDPGAQVWGFGYAGTDYTWMKQALDAGCYDYMDAVAVHPYTYPTPPDTGGFVSSMDSLKTLLTGYAGGSPIKPVVVTEIGWPNHTGSKSSTELDSAIDAVKVNVLAQSLGYVQKLFWYDMQNNVTTSADLSTDPEANFGLIRSTVDETPYSAKLPFVAYNVITHELRQAAFVKSVSASGASLYEFHRAADGKDVLAAFTALSPQETGIRVGDGTFTVTDLLGNQSNYTAVDGVITVNLSNSPIYIENAGSGGIASDFGTAAPGLSLQKDSYAATLGDTLDMEIARSDALAPFAGELRLTLPDGWSVAGDSTFAAGQNPIPLRVQVPASGIESGTYTILIQALSGGNVLGDLRAAVTVNTDPVTASIVPAWQNGGWAVEATLRNNTQTALQGNITVASPAEWAAAIAPIDLGTLEVGQQKVFDIPVSAPGQSLYDLKLDVNLDNNDSTTTFERPISFLAAKKAQAPVQIDGVLSDDEWTDAASVELNDASQVRGISDWGGASDLSAAARLQWDESNLYLAVQVTDDVQFQPSAGSGIWAGDSVQFAFDPGRTNGPGSSGRNEMGMALASDGSVQKWIWTAAVGSPGSFDAMDCQIVRDETAKTTTYEAAIPWSALLPAGFSAAKGSDFGFSLLVNENDGAGRRGWIQYMGGIGDSKDPAAFGDLLLEQDDVALTFDPIASKCAGTAHHALYKNAAEVAAALPQTVTANGAAVTVPVTAWLDTDGYNPKVPGSYTFTAVPGEIPSGYTANGAAAPTVEVVVSAPPHGHKGKGMAFHPRRGSHQPGYGPGRRRPCRF